MCELEIIDDINNYNLAKNHNVSSQVTVCENCCNKLIYTGRQKTMYPPLEVMECCNCKLEYWRETHEKT